MLTLLSFLAALGILVTVHEYGHYRVAKSLGVRILRFSVGFGPVVASVRRGSDDTEFALSAIPLGGYVKMLDEREGEVEPHERHRAFNNQSVGVRSAIVLAGPLANLLLAVVAYCGMFMLGVTGPQPLVGRVVEGSPAARAGLHPGDQILAVEGKPTHIWDNVVATTIDAILDAREVALRVRSQEGEEREVRIDFSPYSVDDLTRRDFFRRVGLEPRRVDVPAVLGEVVPGDPADRAGLRAGDRILKVDGVPVVDWFDWVDAVREHPARTLSVVVSRAGGEVALTVTPRAEELDGRLVGKVGAGGVPPKTDGADLPTATERYGPVDALREGVLRTAATTTTTLKFLGRMVMGEASIKHLSGPVSIARVAGASARLGLPRFLEFLGLMSVSLAVLNLLPIPLLDGGHLMYYLIESIMRRPLPERVQALGQQVGMVLLVGLMVIANYNDLMPYLARLF